MTARTPQKRAEVPARSLYMIAGLLLSLAIPPWFIVAAVVQFSPNIELKSRQAMERPGDVNWRIVERLGDKAWRQPSPATFAALNEGHWTGLCVNGGLTDPIATFENAFGPSDVPEEIRARFDRLVPVGDYDLAISFADERGRVDVIYLVAGGSLQSLRMARCMSPQSVFESG